MPMMESTPVLVDAMRRVIVSDDMPNEERDLLKRYGEKSKAYPLELVELLRRRLPEPRPHLFQLLAGSSVACHPPPTPKPRNPQAEARLAKIKRELEEREYLEMVKDVRRSEIDAEQAGEMRTYKSQLGEGMSIIFSKATAFAIGYYMSRTLHGMDPVHNFICGLAGLIIGLMVDGTLLVLQSTSMIEMKERGRKPLSQLVKKDQ